LLVEKLVLEGADLNAKDSQRWTALLHAVDGNQVELLAIFLKSSYKKF